MMNWILDIYEQTENLFAIVSIILIMVSLYFVYILRFPKILYDEYSNFWTRILGVFIWYLVLFILLVPAQHNYLRDKVLEREQELNKN
jgi:hypothetical protein